MIVWRSDNYDLIFLQIPMLENEILIPKFTTLLLMNVEINENKEKDLFIKVSNPAE